jgi:hypothetical protein
MVSGLAIYSPSPLAGEGRGEGVGRVGSMPTHAISGCAHPLPAPTRQRAAKSAQPSPVKGEGV